MRDLQEISQALLKARRIAIISHENPEGDAIGSSLGAYFGLSALGKEVALFNPDPVPSYLAFLPGSERIRAELGPDRAFDLYLVLDCGDRNRVGGLSEDLGGPLINIDHHKSNGGFGDLNWVDEKVSSTGEMIYHLLYERMALPLTEEAAINLYTAILTDTGSFRFPNTTPESLRISASLLKMGVAPEQIASHLYEERSLGQLQVLGEVLSHLELEEGGRIACGLITQEMLRRGQISLEETEGFVNYPRSLRGVEVAAMFKEAGPGEYRVSLRSKGAVDVGRVASAFLGGGHHNAAGCTLLGDLSEVKQRMLGEIRRWMKD